MRNEKIVVTYEVSENHFRDVIAERSDIEDADAFWQEHCESLVHAFQRGFEAILDLDAEMLMQDAIDAVKPIAVART